MDELVTKYKDFTTRIKIGEQMVIQGFFIIGDTLNEAKKVIPHGEFTNYIVELGYKPETARQYMQVAREIPSDLRQNNDGVIVLTSFRKCLKLASAPDEVKEDVANSKDKEEAERKIREYERQLKEEREAKATIIKNNLDLQERIKNINEKRENDIKSARDEGIKIGRDSKIDEEKEKLDSHYKKQYDRKVSELNDSLKKSYQDRITKLGSELEAVEEELSHYKDVVYKDKEVNRELQRLTEQSESLKRKIDELEYWGALESNLDLAIAQATSLITGDISTNEEDNEVLILSVSRIVNRLRKLTKLLEDNFEIVGERTVYQDENSEIIDVEGI